MWRLLPDDGERDPRTNLAREEAVARRVAADPGAPAPVLRLWRNDPAVVIGRFQLGAAEVDLRAAAALGAPVLRRFSGGGTVWHDPGNLNVSVVARPEDALLASDPQLRRLPGLYRLVLEPLAVAARALGVARARRGARPRHRPAHRRHPEARRRRRVDRRTGAPRPCHAPRRRRPRVAGAGLRGAGSSGRPALGADEEPAGRGHVDRPRARRPRTPRPLGGGRRPRRRGRLRRGPRDLRLDRGRARGGGAAPRRSLWGPRLARRPGATRGSGLTRRSRPDAPIPPSRSGPGTLDIRERPAHPRVRLQHSTR